MEEKTFSVVGRTQPDFATAVYHDRGEARHFHKGYEILIVERGAVTCIVDETEYRIEAGQGAFICPLQLHGFTPEEGARVRQLIFHDHQILTIHKSIESYVSQSPEFPVSERCRRYVAETLEELWGDEPQFFLRVRPFERRMLIKGLLHLLGSEFLSVAVLTPRSKSGILGMEIAQYIAEHYQNDISLRAIAEEKGYNYQYLSRKFNQYVGTSFKKMLNQYRVQCAFQLLQDTDAPISDIAYECGFQSIRSFNQVCMDVYQKTPSQLRATRLAEQKKLLLSKKSLTSRPT